MNTDLISRADAEALFRNARGELHKSAIRNEQNGHPIKDLPTRDLMLLNAEQMIHLLPSVTPKQRTGWIPFTYRPATDEEKRDFAKRTWYDEEDIDTILNCQLPEDGETVLITDRLGNVEVDTFIRDCDGCYFECNCDMEDVRAWMPLPKPYKAESEDKK